MKRIDMFCGRMIFEHEGVYRCVDVYTYQVYAKGSYEECKKVFDEYKNEILEKE